MTPAEVAALPDLILVRAMGTMLWRAERWRRGQSSLAEVANRLDTLAETLRWRTTEGGELEHVVAASSGTPNAWPRTAHTPPPSHRRPYSMAAELLRQRRAGAAS